MLWVLTIWGTINNLLLYYYLTFCFCMVHIILATSYFTQYAFFRHYLRASGQENVTEGDLQQMYAETNTFALASHFLWGTWATVQGHSSNIDFAYWVRLAAGQYSRLSAFFFVCSHLIKQNCFFAKSGKIVSSPNQRRLVPLNKAGRGCGWWALFRGTSCLRSGEETVKKRKNLC